MVRKSARAEIVQPVRFSLSEVKIQSEVIWQDTICGTAIRLTLMFIVVAIGILVWRYRWLPPEVPLFYSRPWGEAQLTRPWGLSLLPGTALIVLVVNGFVGGLVFNRLKLLARMLLVAAALASFMAVFALIRVLLLIS